MVEESLLTEDLRTLIGREDTPALVRVTRRGTERAMELYLGSPARLNLQPGDEVPGYAIAALEPDAPAEGVTFPTLMPNSVLISNEWIFERPLRLDEELWSVRRLADVTERFGGQFGYSLNVRTEVVYRDADGRTVASSATTLMQYDAKNARREGDA